MVDGERIARIRLERGLSQTELGKRAGMTHSQISDIENGKRQPYPRNAKKLADALMVDLDDILGDPDSPWGLQASIRRRADVWDKSGGLCYYCGKVLHPIRDFHVDHFISQGCGGTDDMENLVASCRACNWQKRMDLDWPERREQRKAEGKTWTRVTHKRKNKNQERCDGAGG